MGKTAAVGGRSYIMHVCTPNPIHFLWGKGVRDAVLPHYEYLSKIYGTI